MEKSLSGILNDIKSTSTGHFIFISKFVFPERGSASRLSENLTFSLSLKFMQGVCGQLNLCTLEIDIFRTQY